MRYLVEGVLTPDGRLQLDEPVHLPGPRRAIIEILDEGPRAEPPSSTLETRSVQTPTEFPWSLHYRRLCFLGRGGMGETYKAEDTMTGAHVCIKQLRDVGDRRQLLQECRALARLSHPYVARLLNFDTLAATPYIVMEYVDGIDMGRYLERKGALPEPEAVRIGIRLFQALAYIHSQEVIHRDLKPSNIILVSPEGDPIPKIVDFGLAIVSSRDQWGEPTGEGDIVGTPAYMAPEQFEGSVLGPPCDVYSLAQVIWELRVGRPAFNGRPLELFAKKIAHPDGLLIETVELPGPRLSRVVADCTRLEPGQRPSAKDVVSRLEEVLTTQSVHEPSSSASHRAGPWWKSWRSRLTRRTTSWPKRGSCGASMQTSGEDRAQWRFQLTMPSGGSHTGRYVLLQAVSPRGYPNDEDYILLARAPGEVFRPVYAVHVPFDEVPPLLFDYAANPMVAVVYQAFTLAWTDDGGRTIRTPPHVPEGLFKLWRFGDHCIDWVRLQGDHLYVKTAASWYAEMSREGHAQFVDQVWRVRLDAGAPAERAQPPAETPDPTVCEEVFAQVIGSRLMIRAAPESAWVELAPDTLLAQLRDAKIDFFGGTGARWVP